MSGHQLTESPHRGARLGFRGTAFALALLAGTLAQAGLAAKADAAPFMRGFGDRIFRTDQRDRWLDQAVNAEADIIRVSVRWRDVVGPTPPANPQNPADGAYDFSTIDGAVAAADARGLEVMLTVGLAPDWAEGANRPPGATAGSWKPDPNALGDFGRALARRYSGSFAAAPYGDLPRVTHFEAWNEPNLPNFLSPQFEGNRPVAPQHYRTMLNSFYSGVNEVNRGAKVISAGTAPFGDPPSSGNRMRPLTFLRELLCLKRAGHGRLASTSCANPPRFDILAHHPISFSAAPTSSAQHPDDAIIGDLDAVRRTLRAAEQRGRVLPKGKGHRPVWVTELWWETDPPDQRMGIPVVQQARWIEQALYRLQRQGVQVVILLQIVDQPVGADGFSDEQTGLFFSNGGRKPSYTAYRFPFVVDEQRGPKARVWSIPPARGKLLIQRQRGGRWRTIARGRARAGRVFTRVIRIPSKGPFRAVVGKQASLPWRT